MTPSVNQEGIQVARPVNRLLEPGGNDEQVARAIEEGVQEPRQRRALLALQVVHLVETEQQGLMTVRSDLGQRDQNVLDLLIVDQADSVMPVRPACQTERLGLFGIEIVASQPAHRQGCLPVLAALPRQVCREEKL